LAEAAKIAALPDNYWHESGRWIVTPKGNYIWDRMKKRLLAEAEESGELSAADKRRAARKAKHLEALREKQYRRHAKGLEF